VICEPSQIHCDHQLIPVVQTTVQTIRNEDAMKQGKLKWAQMESHIIVLQYLDDGIVWAELPLLVT
jgi:hypothetical protein